MIQYMSVAYRYMDTDLTASTELMHAAKRKSHKSSILVHKLQLLLVTLQDEVTSMTAATCTILSFI